MPEPQAGVPKDRYNTLHSFHYSPGKRAFHIVFATDDPQQGFEGCARLLRKFGLRLISLVFTSRPKQGNDWSVIVEDPRDVKPEQVREELLKTAGINYALVAGDEDGLVIDKLHFPLVDPGGERAYVISANTLRKVFDKMRDLLGTGGEVVLFNEGEAVGVREVEEMQNMFGKENVARLLPLLPYLFQITGVGKPEVVDLNLETLEAVFRLYASAECEGMKSSTPYSRWVKGQLVGFMSTLFERPCAAEETKCVAMGDPYCEFRIHPR